MSTGAFVIFSSRLVKLFRFFSAPSVVAILFSWFLACFQKAFHLEIGQCTDAMMTPWLV